MRRRAVLLVVAALVAGLGVVTAGPADADTLPAPKIQQLNPATVTSNPTFRWSSVSGAAHYRIQVTKDSSIVYQRDTVGIQATPEANLPTGSLSWSVAAVDASNNVGMFSQTQSFTKNQPSAPQPLSPVPSTGQNVATLNFPDTPPTFTWKPVAGAVSYRLEVDDDQNFVSAQDYTTTNTSFTLQDPQSANQIFYWHVLALSDTATALTSWSATNAYQFDWSAGAPTLIGPLTTTGTHTVETFFRWQPVDGAASYKIQVSSNSAFTNNLVVDTTVKSTSYTPTTALPGGGYYWRVQAVDAAGDLSAWSTKSDGTPGYVDRNWLDAPVQVDPAYDPSDPNTVPHVQGSIDLSWQPIQHASYYELQVGSDANFSPNTYRNCFTNHTEWTPYTALSSSGEPANGACDLNNQVWSTGAVYYWRVRAIDAPSGQHSDWSASHQPSYWRFIRVMPAPSDVSPTTGSTVADPELDWNAVTGAVTYRVTIVDTSSNNPVVNGDTTYATSYTPTVQLTPGTTYAWYAQAIDGDGFISAAPIRSGQRTFTMQAPTTGSTLAATGPADGAAAVAMPTLKWTPLSGADHYTVYVSTAGSQNATPLATSVHSTSFTYGKLLATGTWTWWVEAYNSSGGTLADTTPRSFVVSPITLVLPNSSYLASPGCTSAGACADTPTLQWNPIPGAAEYLVTIATDQNFQTPVRRYETAYPKLTPRESLLDNQAGQPYYWFVRPCEDLDATMCGPAEDQGANQNAASFTKRAAPVDLLSPANGQTVSGRVTFQWNDWLASEQADATSTGESADQEAQSYNVQVSRTSDFAGSDVELVNVDGLSYTSVNITYPNGPIYWRVAAVDASGNRLTWSPTRLVTKVTPAPVLSAPADGAQLTGVPTLSWQPSDYAASYTVEVYSGTSVSGTPVQSINAEKFTAWTPNRGLGQGDYTWRVRATDVDALNSGWTSGRTFHVGAAAATLTGPSDGTTITSGNVAFSWTPVSGAARYRWRLSADGNFGSLVTTQDTVMTTWSPTGDFSDGAYFWDVQAVDGDNNVISTSSTRSIGRDATHPLVYSAVLRSDASPTAPVTITFSEPVFGVSSSTIRVVPDGGHTAVAGSVRTSSGGTVATWTPNAPMTPNQLYDVTVTSGVHDKAGNAISSNANQFRISAFVDNTSPGLGEHWQGVSANGASGHSYSTADLNGATSTLRFTGSSISVVGTMTRNGGTATILLDGKAKKTVSFYSRSTRYKQTLWSQGHLSGTHVVQVRVTGTKPRGSSGTAVGLDAFRVGSATVESSAGAVTQGFRRVSSTSANGGSYDLADYASQGAHGSRPSYAVNWSGTTVSVVGLYSTTAAKVACYVDGKLKQTVDLRSTSTYISTVFSYTSSRSGTHTLRLEPVGTSNGRNSGVGIDYVSVG